MSSWPHSTITTTEADLVLEEDQEEIGSRPLRHHQEILRLAPMAMLVEMVVVTLLPRQAPPLLLHSQPVLARRKKER